MENLDYSLEKTEIFNEIRVDDAKYTGELYGLSFGHNFDLNGYCKFEKHLIKPEPIFEKVREPKKHFLDLIPSYKEVKVGEKEKTEEIFKFDTFYESFRHRKQLILNNKGEFSEYKVGLILNLVGSEGVVISKGLVDELYAPIEKEVLEMYEQYKDLLDSKLISKLKRKSNKKVYK